MTVKELIARLEDADPQAEVLIAHQPNWPLQLVPEGVAEATVQQFGEDVPVVYVVASDVHPDSGPYAPENVFAEAYV